MREGGAAAPPPSSAPLQIAACLGSKAWSTGFDCKQFELADGIKRFTNATAWYVSCGILASILFVREFPRQGAGFPEDFDIRFNEIVIRNFESFVTEQRHRRVVSRDESSVASISAPYPTYECENRHGRIAEPGVAVVADIAELALEAAR